MSLLQIFLLANVFILGIAATVAVQHAYSHFLHKRHPEKDHNALKDSPLPQKLKERLLREARDNFKDALDSSADSLRHDLKSTTDRINLHLEELGNDIVHKEVERYREQLDKLYNSADKDVADAVSGLNEYIKEHGQSLGALSEEAKTVITGANKDIEAYKDNLKTKLDELYQLSDSAVADAGAEITQHTQEVKQQLSKEIAAEKQLLIEKFETKMSDAVASFLLETLKHNVDLGAQSEYLTSMLEEHKKELIEGVSDETRTT